MYDIWISNGIDILLGDPYWFPHPVRFIGAYISFFDKHTTKRCKTHLSLKLSGVLLTLTTVLFSYIAPWLALKLSFYIGVGFYHGINIFILYTCLAGRCLHKEAYKIMDSLYKRETDKAKKQLSYIVGRDVDNMEAKDIARAVVETVSENTGDGIIAPLFYMFIGGAPLALAYKAVNTLDSMVGYKNDKYIDFGWASARLDDIANYLPSRLTALFMIMAAFFLKMNYKNAYNMTKRDGRKHLSPNSGYPEAATAGALGISLGGTNYYFGKKIEKPEIGDRIKELDKEDIKKVVALMYGTWTIALIVFSTFKYLLKGF